MDGESYSKLHPRKIALLHVAKRQLSLTDDDYRAILLNHGGANSAALLNPIGFERVIAHLTTLGFRSTWTKRTFGHRRGMASAAQVDLIRKLSAEYFGADYERALGAWLSHYHGVAALRFVDSETAARIIPGLKAMASRKQLRR